jgi:Transposase DDE domain group 1
LGCRGDITACRRERGEAHAVFRAGGARCDASACGKSEEVHAALKSDLAGGQLPSGRFGANAAWWALAVLAHNLNAAMKKLVLGKAWVGNRMKALRFRLIALPGRVVSHARKLIIRLGAGAEALAMILTARQTIRALRCGPAR